MSFIWPWMLLSLLLVPLFVLLYLRLWVRRQRAVSALGALGGLQSSGGARLGQRRHVPFIVFMIALTVLLISLARPEMIASLPRVEGTVVLAFDVSNSMIADDLEPTRIEAAKAAATAFVENQPSTIQIGVVAFSNGGVLVQPPTNVQADVLEAISRLSPQGGTSLGQGIFTALNVIAGEPITVDESLFEDGENPFADGTIDPELLEIDTYSSAVIMLLTDGENTSEPDPLQIAQLAAEAGVRIFPVGIGDPNGAVIELDGFSVVTQLNEEGLQDIANLTNGEYYAATDEQTLVDIYENVDLQLTIKGEMMEVTSLFAGLGGLLLLVGGALSMLWFGRIP